MELAKSSVVVVLGFGSNDLGPPENGLIDRLRNGDHFIVRFHFHSPFPFLPATKACSVHQLVDERLRPYDLPSPVIFPSLRT